MNKSPQKTNVLNIVGAFCAGILIGIMLYCIVLLPSYNKLANRLHYAQEVIYDCIDTYPTFYDTVGEGDNWAMYVELNQ